MIVPALEIQGPKRPYVEEAPVSSQICRPETTATLNPLAFWPDLHHGLIALGGFGLAGYMVYKIAQWLTEEPRDTYKYVHVSGGRVRHGGITNDLARREREHRRSFGGGHVEQVGRRTTRSAALAWERRNGF